MIKTKGSNIYIKNVQVPSKLEIQVGSGLQNSNVVYNPRDKCKPNNILTINLDPTPFIGQSSSVYNDMNDYIASIIDKFIRNCYFNKDVALDDSIRNDFYSNVKNNGSSNDKVAATAIMNDVRTALEDPTVITAMRDTGGYFGYIFSMVIGNVTMDFEDGFMNTMFNESLDSFAVLFLKGNVKNDLRYSKNSENTGKYNLYGGVHKFYNFKDLYYTLANIFFFYVSQDRRNEVMCGKILTSLDIYEGYRKINSRGEIYVWDNDLETYMNYCPRVENKYLIRDICNDITVPHIVTEGYDYLPIEMKSAGGEKFNPIERKKIELIKGVSGGTCNDITFITMPAKRFDRASAKSVDLSSYIAYRSYENNGGSNDAIGIHLYTVNKDVAKSQMINKIVYVDKTETLLRNYLDELKQITYNDLWFNSMEYALTSPDIMFECNVCYFTKGGGRTFKSNAELLTTKIPKEKRDHVFAALCDLCYELNVDPQLVISRLNVDFTRYYKKPIELGA